MTTARVKVCGITSVDDAVVAVQAGVDAIGLNFYGPSPRAISVSQARDIVAAVGPFVTTVALFVNPDKAFVEEVLAEVKPQLLQFHGDEDSAFCGQFGRPYLKAIRVNKNTDVAAEMSAFPDASGILCDAWSEDLYGGTGKTFAWNKVANMDGLPLILAGGLTPENVGEAISQVSPYGVDVSGGVETAPGIKDARKIIDFVDAAKGISAERY